MHEIRMQHPGRNALSSALIGWLEQQLERGGVARPSEADERRFREQELPAWACDETRTRLAAVLGRR